MGPKNPYGNAFYVEETSIETETGRKRNVDTERYWKFVSSLKKNCMGKPTAYKLEPTNSRATFHDPSGGKWCIGKMKQVKHNIKSIT